MPKLINVMEWKFVAPGYTSERRFEVITDPEIVEKRKAQIEFFPSDVSDYTYDETDRPFLVCELVAGTWPGEDDDDQK